MAQSKDEITPKTPIDQFLWGSDYDQRQMLTEK